MTEKGNIDSVKLTGSEIGKHAAAKSKGLFSAEDWMCSKCVILFNYSECPVLMFISLSWIYSTV